MDVAIDEVLLTSYAEALVRIGKPDLLAEKLRVEGKSRQPFPEESLAKAWAVLNELLLKALKELDDVIIECKESEDEYRGTFDQVMTDFGRLAESIADFGRISAEAQENINVKGVEAQATTAELMKAAAI